MSRTLVRSFSCVQRRKRLSCSSFPCKEKVNFSVNSSLMISLDPNESRSLRLYHSTRGNKDNSEDQNRTKNENKSVSDFLSIQGGKLLRQQTFIGGCWVDSESKETYQVVDPATNIPIASVPSCSSLDVNEAIDAALVAWPKWKSLSVNERSSILRKWYQLILEHIDDLAKILTLESGKPLAEAKGEIMYGASYIEYYAEEIKRASGSYIPSPTGSGDRHIITIKQSIGVCGLITPWNFPAAMITRKLGPALGAGCTCVIKPAEDTPLSCLALATLAEEAGVLPGVINIVTGPRESSPMFGTEIASSKKIRKISFTGSTQVGKLLMAQSACNVKKVSLELGGNAPFIICNDADVEKTIKGIMNGKFRNCGQTCVSPNRFFIQEGSKYERMVEEIITAVSSLSIGHGLQPGVNTGPLINSKGVEKVKFLVDDALKKGAKLHLGGNTHPELGGNFFEPTVLSGITPAMSVYTEEIFGPLVAISSFDNDDDVIYQANDVSVGLASYVFTESLDRAWKFSEELEFGMVSINDGIMSTVVAPFGGIKESGLGREGSALGLDEYTEVKYVNFGGLRK